MESLIGDTNALEVYAWANAKGEGKKKKNKENGTIARMFIVRDQERLSDFNLSMVTCAITKLIAEEEGTIKNVPIFLFMRCVFCRL